MAQKQPVPAPRAPRPQAAAQPAHDAWRSRGFLLRLANLRWEREVGAVLRPLSLTYAQFALLGGVWWMTTHGPAPSQRELSDHTGISPMLASQLTRTLERAGLVRRAPDPVDTRVRRLALTPEGRKIAKRSIQLVDAVERRFFADIDPDDTLIPLLRRIAGRDADGRPLGGPLPHPLGDPLADALPGPLPDPLTDP
jgi:DNA-binding MarR family transcriptional regulator